MMRLFLAIAADELDFDPKLELRKIKIGLEKKEIEHRWVPVQNLHVTIKFLGEVDDARVPDLITSVTEISNRHAPFQLKLQTIGAFPDLKKGRVLWMGVQNSLTLQSLQQECEQTMLKMSFAAEEKIFRPHLTLARLRSPRNVSDIISPLKNHSFGKMLIKRITLYESKLSGAFPLYEPVHDFPLTLTV